MTEETDPVTSRRSLLRLGAGTLTATLSGCQWGTDREPKSETAQPTTGRESPTETSPTNETETAEETAVDRSIPYSDRFETVVDVVADAGADPGAGESIVPMLEEYAGDDTLLYFPEGRYLMDGIWKYPEFTHLGIVGEGATIVPNEGFNNYLFVIGLPGRGSTGFLFEGFEFDFRAPETHPRPIQVQIADDFVVRDVVAHGTSGTARFDATREGGSGLVKRLELPDGGIEPNPVGVLVGPENVGKVSFEDCHVEGFPGNGLYASPSTGPVHVLGGYYANSAIANVRVSGPTVVRDVHVRCDRAPDGFRNMRGIRLRHGKSAIVEDCTIEMLDVTYSEGALVIEPLMQSPTIRNVDIEVSTDDVMAINAKSPMDTVAKPAIECENVNITGTASNGQTIRVVDRDACSFDTLDIDQSGRRRDGIHLIRSHETMLQNARIDVTGDPLVLEQSDVEKMNVSIAQP